MFKTYFYTLPLVMLIVFIPFFFMNLEFLKKLEGVETSLFTATLVVLGWICGTMTGHVNTIDAIIEVNHEDESE